MVRASALTFRTVAHVQWKRSVVAQSGPTMDKGARTVPLP
jgi:hypothetical protein